MPSNRRGPDGLTAFERDICHAIDRGMSDREAYRTVRPESAAADGTAARYVWRVRRRPHCRAYLAALRTRALTRHERCRERIVEELAAVAFADVGDMLNAGSGGPTVQSLAALPPEQRRALSWVKVTRTRHGGTVRFGTHDKMAALDKLCRLFGLFAQARAEADAERAENERLIRSHKEITAMSDVERAQRMAAILRGGGLTVSLAPARDAAAGDGADGDAAGDAAAAGGDAADSRAAAGAAIRLPPA